MSGRAYRLPRDRLAASMGRFAVLMLAVFLTAGLIYGVGALILSENELSGAFKNPGRLGGQTKNDASKVPSPAKASPAAQHSAPIKADLIGTDQDAQLKAAIAQLERANGCGGAGASVNSGVNGAGASPCPKQPAQEQPAQQQPTPKQ